MRASKDRDAEVAALLACIGHPCAAHELQLDELWSELATRTGRSTASTRRQTRGNRQSRSGTAASRTLGRTSPSCCSKLAAASTGTPCTASSGESVPATCGSTTRRDSRTRTPAMMSRPCDGLTKASSWRWQPMPEGLLDQLMDMRGSSLRALGRDADDELAARVEAFERTPGPRPSAPRYFGGTEPEPRPCEHCGWGPDEERAVRMPVKEVEALAEALGRRRPAPGRAHPVTRGKIGRNQPCPCGSGGRYKHCHGR